MARNKKNPKAETLTTEEYIVMAASESTESESPRDAPPITPDVATNPESTGNQGLQPEVPPPRIEEIPLPFTATVNVALAVLRAAPDSPLMEVRPVGTLPLGTPVTITAIHAGNARLKNGLWIKVEFLTPDFAKVTP